VNGKERKACVFGAFVLIAYGIYVLSHPTGDGIVFGTVMGMLAGIGGYALRGALEDEGARSR
jgi:uncharacterized membrane protein HdeD (DUF308 family)